MDKSFSQQESNSVLGGDRADVEGTTVLEATGESTGRRSLERTWWTLTNVSMAALALAMSFGFGVATGEVASASVIGVPVAPAIVGKPVTRFIVSRPANGGSCTPKDFQRAALVSDTRRLGTVPQHMCNSNPQRSPQHGGWE